VKRALLLAPLLAGCGAEEAPRPPRYLGVVESVEVRMNDYKGGRWWTLVTTDRSQYALRDLYGGAVLNYTPAVGDSVFLLSEDAYDLLYVAPEGSP